MIAIGTDAAGHLKEDASKRDLIVSSNKISCIRYKLLQLCK